MLKIKQCLSLLICAAMTNVLACDDGSFRSLQDSQESSAENDAVAELEGNDSEFRRGRTSSTRSRHGQGKGWKKKKHHKRRRRQQCVFNDLGDQFSKASVKVDLLTAFEGGVQILEGERVSLRIENRGSSDLEGGILSAFFLTTDEQRDDYVTNADKRRNGFGWGRFKWSPDGDPSYDGAAFLRLRPGKSVTITPEVDTSCDGRFPYDAVMGGLSLEWNMICRAGRRDGGFSATLFARNRRGSKRVLGEVSFEPCYGQQELPAQSTLRANGYGAIAPFAAFQAAAAPGLAGFPPPRGPANYYAGSGLVTVY